MNKAATKKVLSLKKTSGMEVIKMKKLLIAVAVMAVVISFLPKAHAGETAQLGLRVTFKEQLKIWTEPAGPFKVVEGETLKFKVIAGDSTGPNGDIITLTAENLPKGATFVTRVGETDLNQAVGYFNWTPAAGQAQEDPYIPLFAAMSADGTLLASLKVEITVREGRVISIEVTPDSWRIGNIGLGDRKTNADSTGIPMHKVINNGTIPVMVDIGYGISIVPRAILPPEPIIHPGTKQGLDTFVTWVGQSVLPPNGRVNLKHVVDPNGSMPLSLTYGAPTGLSHDAKGHSANYEVRAYPPIVTE